MLLSSPELDDTLRRYCIPLNANKNKPEGIAGLSFLRLGVSATHFYILSPDGRLLEHIDPGDPRCKPAMVCARIRSHARSLPARTRSARLPPAVPVGLPERTRPTGLEASDVALFVTSRFVVANTDEARGRPFQLPPRQSGDITDNAALYKDRLSAPTGEWVVLPRAIYQALLPPGDAAIGARWALPSSTATALLLRFRAPAHHSDLTATDVERVTLDETLISRDGDIATCRLSGYVRAADPWTGEGPWTGKKYWAQSSVVGYLKVDMRKESILSLSLVTLKDAAFCGLDGTSLPFVSVMSMR